MIDYRPYQESRNKYWAYLTEFKDNYGYLNRSHTFDNFKKFVELEQIKFSDDSNIIDVWNWYFI